MTRKDKQAACNDPLATPPLPVRRFGAADTAEILGIPGWRLQKYLVSERYKLSPPEQLGGKGRGSRRIFTEVDVLRIGVANRLVQDGFAPNFVAEVVQTIQDTDLLGLDEEFNSLQFGLALCRGTTCPRADVFRWDRLEQFVARNHPYYVLNLSELTNHLLRRMDAATKH